MINRHQPSPPESSRSCVVLVEQEGKSRSNSPGYSSCDPLGSDRVRVGSTARGFAGDTNLDRLVSAALRQPIAPTPPLGEPCNGCGLCCIEEVCGIGQMLGLDGSGPCRGLRFEDGRYWCGPVRSPEAFGLSEEAAVGIGMLLGVGEGCCADIEEFERAAGGGR